MSRAYDKALEAFPISFSERMGYKSANLPNERRNAFEKGYEQALKDIWHNVKDEKPELRRTVICVNELVVEAELYTDDNELDEIEHYTKWCYLDDILPKE